MSHATIQEFIREASALAAKYRIIAQRERSLLPESEVIRLRWLLGIVYPFESWLADLRLGEGTSVL